MNVTIVGLGLIGGSLAKDLRQNKLSEKIFGVDASTDNASLALSLQLVDEVISLESAVEKSDVIVLSIPVDAITKLLPELLDMVKGTTKTVVDMGSTKGIIADKVANHPQRLHYVAAHPIAGTEYSGPSAAVLNLFNGKTVILCDIAKSGQHQISVVTNLFEKLNMRIVEMEAHEHDVHLAFVSHLSHVTSFALGCTVLDIERDKKNILDLAGSGFASTVRLAKSSPEMWTPIFLQNAEPVLKALDAYIHQLEHFKKMLTEKNASDLYRFMRTGNEIKKVLN